MSYQTGRLGVAGGAALVFFLTVPPLFLSNPAVLLQRVASTAWLALLGYSVIPMLMFLLQLYVFQRVPGDFFAVTQQLLGRIGAWLFSLYYTLVFAMSYILLMRQFAENTLSTALPQINFTAVILVYTVTSAILVYAGIEGIARGAYLIMPLVIVALLIVLLLLLPYYNVYRLTPWQGNGLDQTIQISFELAGLNFGVLALMVIAPSFQGAQTIKTATLFGFGAGVLLRTLSTLVYSVTFGVPMGKERILPFYEMARLVYINRYLQRIEALFIVFWVFSGILGMAISLYFALYLWTRIFHLPTIRPLVPIAALLLSGLAMIPPDLSAILNLQLLAVHALFNISIYMIPPVLVVALMIRKRKGDQSSCSAES